MCMHNVCDDIMRKMEVNIGESNSLCSPVTIPLSVVAGTLLEHLRTTSYRALRSNGLSCDFGHRQIPQLDMCSPMCSSCCLQVINNLCSLRVQACSCGQDQHSDSIIDDLASTGRADYPAAQIDSSPHRWLRCTPLATKSSQGSCLF